jgi:hypothetical protein
MTTQATGWASAFKAFLDRRALIMLFLGFSAGIPILLIFSSLSLWLGEAGIDKSAVTFFSWAALGYSFKFVWAPLIDELPVPVSLLLIFVLLYFTFRSFKQAGLIFTAIPMSAIGGVLALLLRGMPFSISAGIGFIALFGVAVLNGIVLIGTFNQYHSRRRLREIYGRSNCFSEKS